MDLEAPVVGEDELLTFRQQWKEEVSAKVSHKDKQQAPQQHTQEPQRTPSRPSRRTDVTATASSSAMVSSISVSPGKKLVDAKAVAPVVGDTKRLSKEIAIEAAPLKSSELAKPSQLAVKDSGPVLDKSLQAYLSGTRCERMGNLAEALKFYREAHRLDPDVERKFRELPPRPAVDDPNSKFYTFYDFPTISADGEQMATSTRARSGTDSLVEQFRALDLSFTPMRETRVPSTFFRLPAEILSQIITWTVLLHGQSAICPISLVSRKMFVLCAEQSVWRRVCERVHTPIPTATALPEVPRLHDESQHERLRNPEEQEPSTALTMELPLYNHSWFDMWLDRPRIRGDGIFISRMNYVRQGVAVESYYAPVHLISYFRYIRFFPADRRVVFWTSTIEPATAVRQMAADALDVKLKGLMLGTYTLEGKHLHLDMTAHDRRGARFKASLEVLQSRRGRMNKLVWVAYYQEKNNTRSDIPLETLRPFMFSKVNSYPRSLA
ncbi:hypothetical protein DFJ77DRAFT_480453 [Powellomyces hirtus]|nr:hypothetical protein DFJ77DRAFT_480453 [Powellomyces hirtus]